MLATLTIIFLLQLLPLRVNGLITTDAKCLAGYNWMFSSIGQSPCDVAAELASVCVGRPFNLPPIGPGYVYAGPTKANENACRCSSVYYSLLSCCAYCQGRDYLPWSVYDFNCTTVYLKVYNGMIPDGVKVPAYAYQDVSVSDSFDVTLAQSLKGVESSRGTLSSTPALGPVSTSITYGPTVIADVNGNFINNTPAIIGCVVGGVIGLGLIGVLIAFLVLRARQEPESLNYTYPIPSTLPPGSPGSPGSRDMLSNVNAQRLTTLSSGAHGQRSPPLNENVLPDYTENSNRLPPQTAGHSAGGRSHFNGMPEL